MRDELRGTIRYHHSKLAFFYRVSDALLILLVLKGSIWIYGVSWSDHYFDTALATLLMFYIIGESGQIYRLWRGMSFAQLVPPILSTWTMAVVAGFLVIGYMTKTTGIYSRVVMGIWAVCVPMALILWRILVREVLGYVRSKGYNRRAVAIAGRDQQARALSRIIQETPSLGFHFKGFFDDPAGQREYEKEAGVESLAGDLDALVNQARSGQLDMVYIGLPMEEKARINRLLDRLADGPASVYLVPDLFYFNLFHARWLNIGPIATISVYESPFYGVEGWAKRAEDIMLSILILGLTLLPMLAIAIGVKLSSPGPILFKQRRYGMDGKEIRVWKFRTMRVSEDGDVIVQACPGDARVTRFGAFLRRTSLDELPQFFNTLMGSMSIVGPRPHAVAHNEEYRRLIAGYMLRHKVKPGITGWAQVHGWRGETDTLDKMRMRVEFDFWYIQNWSLWLDIQIILMTLFRGFTGKNAY